MIPANQRFAAWVVWLMEHRGVRSQRQVGELLGCHQVTVSQLISGERKARGHRLVSAIERATAEWPEGPIRGDEWLATAAAEAPATDGAAA